MLKLILSIILTIAINYIVPFLAYAFLLAVGLLPPVENDSPGLFLLSLLIHFIHYTISLHFHKALMFDIFQYHLLHN
jgi:hypothetical protein